MIAPPPGSPSGRPVGRPRSTEADDAIRAATIEVFAEFGYEGMKVETVAARAGVAKSTLYRRFPCKTDLVQHALSTAADELPCPHTESLADDLVSLVTELREKFASQPVGRLAAVMVEASARHPELRAAHQRFIAQRRRRGLGRLAAAIDEGDLPADTDTELLMDSLGGVVFYRSFVSGGALDDEILRSLIERTLAAHGARPSAT